MRVALLFVSWLLAMVTAGFAAPASAQMPPSVPYIYDEVLSHGIARARRDKPADQIAAETAAADAAETRCDAGNSAGCANLGRAFLYGAGRPQNRPVAELLLRQACDAAEAAGCLDLGVLLGSIGVTAARIESRLVLARGCRLGNLDACNAEADAVAAGTDGDPKKAQAMRRAACDKGSGKACRWLGSELASSDDPAVRADGLGLLERQCRSGDAYACNWIAHELGRQEPVPTSLLVEMTDKGCVAGSANLCRELGFLRFAEASGPPETRSAALAAFDRACALEDGYCQTPANIRRRPVLAESCARGVQADCLALGQIYADSIAPLYSPAEAVQLLGGACEAGMAEACGGAVRAKTNDDVPETPEDDARIAFWLDLGCQDGQRYDCATLGKKLLDGEPGSEDRARGYALLERACALHSETACEDLDQLAFTDPDAPILSVDWRYRPPLTPEEAAEEERLKEEEKAREEADRCSVSQVSFRGSVWHDRVCQRSVVAITQGRNARPGEAPWQALFWRPEVFNGGRISRAQQVECGGALVRDGWVLTAAHCVVDEKKRLTLTPGHTVRLGVYDAQELQGESYGISQVFVHPNYHEKARVFDIALVRLNTTRRIRRGTVGPIRTIPFDDTPPEQRIITAGTPVFVYGWGLTRFEGTTSNRLKAAELKTEAPSDCEKRTRTDQAFIKSSLICAKAADRSQACDGDSGGPLVRYEQAEMRSPVVIGVVSSGTKCGESGVASSYTRVGKMTDWIVRVLRGVERPITPRATR